MVTITIPKNLIKNDDLVIVSRKEYESLKACTIPTFYLKGKEAEKLDKLVKGGMKEYQGGKCKTIKSLADLD
ncbi:MAG: hypothetical protein AAB688_00300 [Patescibacteria group bacterium]